MERPSSNQEFNTTHWSIVTSSKDNDSKVRNGSLSELCKTYWYPLFAYLRRKGHAVDIASDYVQGFFVELIDKEDFLASVEPDKGRFRWFLMSAIQRYISKQTEKQLAQKRGGNRQIFSLDIDSAEQRYQREPVDGWTPEKLFDRRWALQILSQALSELRESHLASGKVELYDALQPTLAGEVLDSQQCNAIGESLGMSPVAVKVAAHRLKDKYRRVLVQIVSQTLSDPADPECVDEELNTLLQALAG